MLRILYYTISKILCNTSAGEECEEVCSKYLCVNSGFRRGALLEC